MIRLLPTPKRPLPGLFAALDSNHLLAIAPVEQRMPILLDIETLMPGFGPGLGALPPMSP